MSGRHICFIFIKSFLHFRQILLSDVWADATRKAMPSTNMYIMLKKKPSTTEKSATQALLDDNFFLPNKKFSLSTEVEKIVINFLYSVEEKHNCCSDLKIFEDTPKNDTASTVNTSSSCVECEWYQAKVLVTGFKDCYVGKISASDLW